MVEDVKLEKTKPAKPGLKAAVEEKRVKPAPSILVSDDDEDTRKLVERILKNRGYQVTLSEDGIDVLLRLGRETYDLLLVDINMPNLDGFQLLEMMNQKGIQAPVIFLTARDSLEDERRGLELGAMDYIKKPIQKEILALRVKSALDKIKAV
ncbi:MAG TPA: response regulator [Deltaproteobacteria bacterium]|nr:response regulator [Deltaproteobacteria bacterium]